MKNIGLIYTADAELLEEFCGQEKCTMAEAVESILSMCEVYYVARFTMEDGTTIDKGHFRWREDAEDYAEDRLDETSELRFVGVFLKIEPQGGN